MEMELKSLIEKIKTDGVEQAQRKSEEILQNAKNQAQALLDEAHKKSAQILKQAEAEASRIRKNTEQALQQAARDLILSLRSRITELFSAAVKRETGNAFSGELLKEIILKVIESFRKEGIQSIEVVLTSHDKERLERALLGALSEELQRGVTLKVSPAVEKGFRIGEKDKNIYYDFTDESITESLMVFINPKLLGLLNIVRGNV